MGLIMVSSEEEEEEQQTKEDKEVEHIYVTGDTAPETCKLPSGLCCG